MTCLEAQEINNIKSFALSLPSLGRELLINNRCTPFAFTSILEYYHYKNTQNYQPLSFEFLYHMLYQSINTPNRGSTIFEIASILQTYGCILEKDYDNNFNYIIKDNKYNYRDNYKIKYIASIMEDQIKLEIYNGNPLIGVIPVYSQYSINENYLVQNKNSKIRNYHSAVVFGWNEKGYIIQNSWKHKNTAELIIPFRDKFIQLYKVIL